MRSPAGRAGTSLLGPSSLADLLAAVHVDGADPATLDTYDTIRRPVAREVVRFTDRMTRAATLAGPAAVVRNTALSLAGRIPAVRSAVA